MYIIKNLNAEKSMSLFTIALYDVICFIIIKGITSVNGGFTGLNYARCYS